MCRNVTCRNHAYRTHSWRNPPFSVVFSGLVCWWLTRPPFTHISMFCVNFTNGGVQNNRVRFFCTFPHVHGNRPSQLTQLTRNTSRSSAVSSALGTAHITSENCRPRVPICLAVVCGNSFRHSTPPLGDRGKPYVAPWYTMTSVILVLSCLVSYLPRYCRYRTTSPYSPTVVHLLRRRTTNRAEKFADMKVWFLQ